MIAFANEAKQRVQKSHHNSHSSAAPANRASSLHDGYLRLLPDIYQQAFNSAWSQYKEAEDRRGDDSREEVAHKVAWAAVKKEYEKGDDD